MILDPERDGCTVWQGMFVTHVKGSPREVCDILYPKITEEISEDTIKQVYNIGLDITGMGMTYKDILESMDIQIYPIKGTPIHKMLANRNPKSKKVNVNRKEFNMEYDTVFTNH